MIICIPNEVDNKTVSAHLRLHILPRGGGWAEAAHHLRAGEQRLTSCVRRQLTATLRHAVRRAVGGPVPHSSPTCREYSSFVFSFRIRYRKRWFAKTGSGQIVSGKVTHQRGFVSFAPSVVNAAGASKDPHGLAVDAVQASAVSEAGRSAAQRKPTVPCRKNNAVFWSGLLLMFVPSLSWQIDRVLHQTMVPKTHCYAPHARSGRP